MTERVRIEHDFDCSEKAFWETFLDPSYNKEMFCGRMKFPRWDVVSFEVSESEMRRVVEVEPYVGKLPGPIKKVLGDSISYREEGHLDRSANSYQLRIVPSKLADKILVSGKQHTSSLGEHKCRRTFDATIEVKIFGIGSMIEKSILSDLTKSYDIGAVFTRSYLQQHDIF